jgi:hypothetical protein
MEAETKDILRMLCKRYDLTQNDVLKVLLEMCDQHDLLKKEWQKRLTAALERGKREIEAKAYYDDPRKCPAMAMGSEKYKCVWGREGRPPAVRVLEVEYQASLEMCLKCKATLQIMQESEGLRSRVVQLENKLKQKSNIEFKIPICHKGATLNEDSTEFSGCPKHPGENVSIDNFCKVYSNGLPCALFAQRVIGVADQESGYGSEFSR